MSRLNFKEFSWFIALIQLEDYCHYMLLFMIIAERRAHTPLHMKQNTWIPSKAKMVAFYSWKIMTVMCPTYALSLAVYMALWWADNMPADAVSSFQMVIKEHPTRIITI